MARRLEGFEGAAPPALVPGGPVANRLLEDDAPRYMRASDHCEPRVKGEHGPRYRGDFLRMKTV